MKQRIIYSAIGLTVAEASLIILYVVTGSAWMAAAAAILLLIPLLSFLWNIRAAKGLKVEIKAETGKIIKGKITVNGKLPPAGILWCRITVCNRLTGETGSIDVPMKSDAKGFTGEFSLESFHCGQIRIEVSKILAGDPFGLIYYGKNSGAKVRTAVMPATFPVETEMPRHAASPDEGSGGTRKGADYSEMLWLREYRPGDSLKGIHWKLSSKTDKLIYREPGRPEERSMLIWWDPHISSPKVMDALADAMFSVVLALSENGYPFTVGWSENGEVHFETPSGEDELNRLLPVLLCSSSTVNLPEAGDKFGSVLYFTTAIPMVSLGDSVQIYCCAEEESDFSDGVMFTPENYRDQLQRLDVGDGN